MASRWGPLLVGWVVMLVIWPGRALAGDPPTNYHAGVLRSVDWASRILVIDERARVGPSVLTRIRLTDGTVLPRVTGTNREFTAQPVPLDQPSIGEYMVVRGSDHGGQHLAVMIWSLGPAE